MSEEQALVAGDGEAQILDIDPAQLAALLAQSADGSAQLIDEHGNTITLTVDQLAEAGIDVQQLAGAQVLQLGENQQYVQGDDGQIYIIEGDESAVAAAINEGGIIDAGSIVTVEDNAAAGESIPAVDNESLMRRQQESTSGQRRSGSGGGQQLQLPAPIMSAPKPVPSSNQQSPKRMVAASDHDQRMSDRREQQEGMMSPLKTQHNRRVPSDHQFQQQHVLMNNASVNNIPSDRLESSAAAKRAKLMAQQQRVGVEDIEMESNYILQGEEMQNQQTAMISRARMAQAQQQQQQQQQQSPHAFRRGNFQAGLLPFQCDQCPRRFAHDHHLKRHQEMAHAKKRPFYCKYCKRDLYLASDLHFQGHLRMQHKQDMEFEASYNSGYSKRTGSGPVLRPPGLSPTSQATGATSEENEEEEPDWDALDIEKQREVANAEERQAREVEDQDSSTINEEQISKQSKATTDSTTKSPAIYICNVCQKRFRKQEWLDKHKVAHTDQQPFSCQYCPRRFKWKENLIRHLNWHMERMPYKCSLCPKGFPSQMRLDVHYKSKHLPKQREHLCPICQKGFFEKEYLAKHMRIHGSKIFPCTECDKKFIDEKFLRRHMFTHTQYRDFTCDVCGKVFNRAIHLKSHRTIHTGERPYKCESCPLTFGFKHNLRIHEKAEHGPAAKERSHVCEFCGRSFSQKSNLDVHLRVHRGLKPFQCSSCLRQFSRLEHLRTHVNAHAGIRDHQCTVCEKYFYSESNLRQHKLVHLEEGGKAFQCGSCPKKFKQRQQLSRHLKTHTKNPDAQYVVIWEKGGSLLEAVIITDGVAQDATQPDDATASGTAAAYSLDKTVKSSAELGGVISDNHAQGESVVYAINDGNQEQTLQISEMDAAQLLAAVGPGAEVLDASQLQLVDEHGNPIQAVNVNDQLLILQDGTIAAPAADNTGTTGGSGNADGATVIDPNTLLALAAEGQGEDGTLYITEESLQALAQQGLVFSYEESAQ